MRLARVYKKTPHIFKRFCMYESVYSIRRTMIISVITREAFNTEYTSEDRLTKEMGHEVS